MASSGSHKYLYERLGDQRFQQLCAALVLDRYADVSVFPVGEKDGGRDITFGKGKNRTILQVKWTGNRSRKPVSWLKSQVEGEAGNIKRLVDEGCKQYMLITNVEGSATPGVGGRDTIERALDDLGKKYGIPMSCLWASDLDAWVDGAPFEIKMAYVDMLAGTDALLALLRSQQLQDHEARVRDLLVTYVGTHWQKDKRVKFRQVDLTSDVLTDLFVDLTARRSHGPRRLNLPNADIGLVAKHLLDPHSPPLTLIEGVPGQGKSTVVQYVSQVYRAAFLGRDQLKDKGESLPAYESDSPRVAIRIDLSDYAEWVSGHDPFAAEDNPRGKISRRAKADIERFLVAHFEAAAPGHELTAADIRSVLDRFPTYVVFDGLDEVASAGLRERVVTEIDEFTSRWVQSRPGNMRIVVSTRPNASGLPEPASDIYDKIVLQPLDEATRRRYLRKWSAAQHIDGPERHMLQKVFGERTAAPHVAQLAGNPMQLTILLHLIRTKGESLPTARTGLYRAYMDLFLEREAAKSRIVLDNRPALEEATSYIGWFMQALTEVDASSSRLPAPRIVREMTKHLAGVGKIDAPVGELFDAMRDRVWVLTSKQSGTYEFDVQSIREFFAARFLYEYADSGGGCDYDPAAALIELLPRSYWANTARFLGGHFQTREVSDLADRIESAFDDLNGARQTRTTVWALLSDGIFKERAPSQKRVAELFASDLSVRFLAPEITEDAGLPPLPYEFGGRALSNRLLELLEAEPCSPLARSRGIVASSVTDSEEFLEWWEPRAARAAGTDTESAWLEIGQPQGAGLHLSPRTVEQLAITSPSSARGALAAGVSPPDGTPAAKRLLEWTLAGHCSDVAAQGTSEAADLLRVVAPHLLLSMAAGDGVPGRLNGAGHRAPRTTESQRTMALRRLAARLGSDRIQKALRISRGEKGTTSRWVDTARALSESYGGPCWLATEIVAIAAALSNTEIRTGGSKTKDAPCFGPDMDYGQWLPGVRQNRSRSQWWQEQRSSCCTDHHSRAAWVLGLLVAADLAVVTELLPSIIEVVSGLPADDLNALVASSSRIASSGIARELDIPSVKSGTPTVVRLLLAHHATAHAIVLGNDPQTLREAVSYPVGGWPAARTISAQAARDPSEEALVLVEMLGAMPNESLPVVRELSADTAERILTRPDRYPAGWLTVADRALTAHRYGQSLKTHSDTHWGI